PRPVMRADRAALPQRAIAALVICACTAAISISNRSVQAFAQQSPAAPSESSSPAQEAAPATAGKSDAQPSAADRSDHADHVESGAAAGPSEKKNGGYRAADALQQLFVVVRSRPDSRRFRFPRTEVQGEPGDV